MCTNPFCLGEPWCTEWDCCSKEPPAKKTRINHVSSPAKPSRFLLDGLDVDQFIHCMLCMMYILNVLMY